MNNDRFVSIWLTVAGLATGIIGLVFILVSVFDKDAGSLALIVGLLFVALGSLLNIARLRQIRRNQGR